MMIVLSIALVGHVDLVGGTLSTETVAQRRMVVRRIGGVIGGSCCDARRRCPGRVSSQNEMRQFSLSWRMLRAK